MICNRLNLQRGGESHGVNEPSGADGLLLLKRSERFWGRGALDVRAVPNERKGGFEAVSGGRGNLHGRGVRGDDKRKEVWRPYGKTNLRRRFASRLKAGDWSKKDNFAKRTV